jgi:hypothetical protein
MDKKYIIDEIIRIAKENNDIPPGRLKFASESGIKESDWFPEYWTEWSEALREAGFNPNKMRSAYNETVLIEYAISLIKELKKFPTTRDFKFKAHHMDDFPWDRAFHRLGKKSEMAQKILNYCKNNPGYEDVIEICKEISGSSEKTEESDTGKDNVKFSYVYLMKSGQYYKIGQSDCVEKRNYEIGIKLPEELKIIHKIKTDDPNGIEAYWHKRFEDKRKRGEWFDLSKSDIKTFRRRTFM